MIAFKENIRLALADQGLIKNLRGAMDFLVSKRSLSIKNQSQWQAYKNFASKLRQQSTQALPELLELLEKNCSANGIKVHWAEDADQANKIILKIAHETNTQVVVKGKSMASEEIEFNQFMAQQGIEALESDMGEFIVQLADEGPSHIIMPALHKNQKQIAELFETELGCEANENDVDQLIGIGRRILREKFEQADMGLSGVNFAIAETGTLCLLENEGNGRMSTTVPRTHVALMGIDKVIPSFEALPALLHILTRSATGQEITTYLNLISSPRKENELDGPEQVHLVILDNGRSQIASDQTLNQTLSCIRCGACMNHCPVYTRIGGHAYGSTYPGPIGQVISPQLKKGEKFQPLLSACSLNGACGEACPVDIPLPDLIRTLRSKHHSIGPKYWIEKLVWFLWRLSHSQTTLYALSSKLLRLKWFAKYALPRQWREHRSVPKAAPQSLHQLMRERKHEQSH